MSMPEAAAAAMRARPDVEYAQPRYRNHAMARPNDTLYANQWNFPAIDMERAWDIQPGASADIIVAVLDSGMAFPIGLRALQLALPVSGDAERAAVSRARQLSMCRLRPRRSWAPAARRGSRRRAISSGTTICPSISTGMARTSRHDRTTDNNGNGTGRHGLQRPVDAGESDPGNVG
jgi:hypothetical protein